MLATTWLLIINDEIEDYDQNSADHNVPIDPNDPPPGCTLTNSTASPVGNFTDMEASFWNTSRVYNEGNYSLECQPVDITIGESDESHGLSGGAIAGIVIGSVAGCFPPGVFASTVSGALNDESKILSEYKAKLTL